MKVINSVYPNEAQIKGFSDPGPDGPIYMVNLLKFRARAEYPDQRETDLTGQQAHAIIRRSRLEADHRVRRRRHVQCPCGAPHAW